jgi:uncharacterized protein
MRFLSVIPLVLTSAMAAAQQTPDGKAPPLRLTPEQVEQLREIAFQAAREGDVRTLREYFAAGRPVNETNSRGDTLLIVAAYHGQSDAVAVILSQKGVTIDARNRMGLTALTAAAFKGQVGIARVLLKAGADVNAANGSNQTALMFAALTGRTAMVDLLIEAGADVTAADRQGNTPLSLARAQGAEDVVKRLEAALAAKKQGKSSRLP